MVFTDRTSGIGTFCSRRDTHSTTRRAINIHVLQYMKSIIIGLYAVFGNRWLQRERKRERKNEREREREREREEEREGERERERER